MHVPGLSGAARLHVHHIKYRSRGGGDEPWNFTVVCEFHHGLLHREQIHVTGRAPFELDWSPPKLMREVLERRRNRSNLWLGELEVREWSLDPRANGLSELRAAV